METTFEHPQDGEEQDVPLPEASETLETAPGAKGEKGAFGNKPLRPAPAAVKTLNKKLGPAIGFFAFALLVAIMYGIMSRSARQKAAHTASGDDDKSVMAASSAAKDTIQAIEYEKSAAARAKALGKPVLDANGKPVLDANGQPVMDMSGVPTTPVNQAGVNAAAAAGAPYLASPGMTGATVPPLSVVPLKAGVPRLPERTNGIGGGGAVPAASSSVPVQAAWRGPSAEEREREAAYKLEQEAMSAGTGASKGGPALGGSALGRALGGGSNPAEGLLSELNLLGHPGASGAASQALPAAPRGAQDDVNLQDEKESFISKAHERAKQNYLLATRTAPISKYEIKSGWNIPAVLEQKINSDLPGEIRALVRENVYDTATGKYLLIPQGSRVVGKYDSRIAYGQSRVEVVWDEVIFPDGSTMNLEGMLGEDAGGQSGLTDKVNRHYLRMFGMALMTSAFTAGIEISQGSSSNQSATVYPSNSQIATQALGQQMGQLGIEIARKNMDVQPTITVPSGYRFAIRVSRDIAFADPYVPQR